MEEIIISSTLLNSLSYHGKTMYVKLNDKRLLSYNNVPQEVFNEFIKTNAPDKFYKKRIVPNFSFQRMV